MTTVALVPALRRADRVGETVKALSDLVDRVVVVDDGSADGGATAGAAQRAGATVVVLPSNRGKGGALAAGIAVTPEATAYLLVDADTADTAAATAPLLAALRQGADLAVGVLPSAEGQGGFGTVRRAAAWGIRSACGFEAEAPLSGQRAVGAPLLRSLELADRFGVEVGMTIDAVRAGAQVVEVPVLVDHAHTGRSVAGFAHRAAQGWDLLRALWPRLLGERARVVLFVGAALAMVAVLAASAVAAVPSGAPLGRADQVVLVATSTALRLEDLQDTSRPELAALAGRRGAVAAANVDVPGRSVWSSWATVGAGKKVRAEPPVREPDAANPFQVQDIPDGQGRLGDALHRGGLTTAFVGTMPSSPVRLSVADGAGRIDRAATAGSLGVNGLVNQIRASLTTGADVLAVDAAGLDPDGLEALLAGLRPGEGVRRLVLLVTPADRIGRFGLRPMVASGPGAAAGRLVSPSTHRSGLVVLSDVAPTILTALDVPVPGEMLGQPLRYLAAPADVEGLVAADRLARQRDSVWDPALAVVVPLHLAAYAWAAIRARRRSGSARADDGEAGGAVGGAVVAEGRGARRPASRALGQLGLGLAAWPLATWLVRWAPGSSGLGRGAGALALALDLMVVAVAGRLGRGRGLVPLVAVLGATLALITVDLGRGGALQLSSAFGGAAHSTGRFTGLGNTAFAIYATCALLAVSCARRRAPWMIGLLVLVAAVDALPLLGADVGGAATLTPIFAMTIAALWGRLRRLTVVLAGVATAAVFGVAIVVDLSRPAESRTHLARFVTGGGRSNSIGGKLAQNLDAYAAIPLLALVVAITLGFAFLVWRGRFGLALPKGSPARIGVGAALAVALVGNILNDSGPIVTLIAMSVIGPALVVRAAAGDGASPDIRRPLPPPTPALVTAGT